MKHESYNTWSSFAFSTTVQLGWPNSHFLFPLWLLVPIPSTSAPRHTLFCSLSAHVGSAVTSFLREGLQAVLKMDSSWQMSACAQSAQPRVAPASPCSSYRGGAVQKAFNICSSGYFQRLCIALFEILNLIWGCLGLPEVIPVIYKREGIWSY